MVRGSAFHILIGCGSSATAFLVFYWVTVRIALAFHVSELLAVIFGRPTSPYSFQNLVVPRLLVLLIAAIPAGLAGKMCYRALATGKHQFHVLALTVGIAFIAILFGFAVGDPSTVAKPLHASLFVGGLIAFSAGCTYYLIR